jgi:hypothetical protein
VAARSEVVNCIFLVIRVRGRDKKGLFFFSFESQVVFPSAQRTREQAQHLIRPPPSAQPKEIKRPT